MPPTRNGIIFKSFIIEYSITAHWSDPGSVTLKCITSVPVCVTRRKWPGLLKFEYSISSSSGPAMSCGVPIGIATCIGKAHMCSSIAQQYPEADDLVRSKIVKEMMVYYARG